MAVLLSSWISSHDDLWARCVPFESDQDRYDASERWEKELRKLLKDDPNAFWLYATGQSPVPKPIMREVNQQIDCMLRSLLMEKSVGESLFLALGMKREDWRSVLRRIKRHRLPRWVRGKMLISHYRSAKIQALIWKKRLRERGEEGTLRTSSIPGTSRHHWGSEIDLFQTSSERFRKSGSYHNAYQWLRKNAPHFGFYQSFQGDQDKGLSYIEERWHWSYGPIAEPMLNIVAENIIEYERNLKVLWRYYEKVWNRGLRVKTPYFKHAESVWRHFVFNVSEGGFLLEKPVKAWFPTESP